MRREMNFQSLGSWWESNLSISLLKIKETAAYRASMLISLLTGPIFIVFNYIIWKAIYGASGTSLMGGFTFDQIVVYYVIMALTNYFTWDDTEEDLAEKVETGDLTSYLVKPISYIRYSFFNKMGHRTVAALIEAFPVVLLVGIILGFGIFSTRHMLEYAATIVIAIVISFQIRLIVGLSAFWLTKPRGFIWLYRMSSGLLSGFIIPLTFFPPAIQGVLAYLPFQFTRFVPAQAFLGGYSLAGISLTPAGVMLYGLAYIVCLSAVTWCLWKLSVKRFCGVGT